ncbi:MAG: hypothetical protein KAW41_06095 [Candidatus Diapherotrites archaeon]|nr:hypothetical protein [Candidatus Diapherotrites archaeon]
MPIVPVTKTMAGQKEVVTLADGRVVIPGAEAERLGDEALGFFRAATILGVVVIVLFMAGSQMHSDIAMLLGYALGAIVLATVLFSASLWHKSHLFEIGRFELQKKEPGLGEGEPEAKEEPVQQDTEAFKPSASEAEEA